MTQPPVSSWPQTLGSLLDPRQSSSKHRGTLACGLSSTVRPIGGQHSTHDLPVPSLSRGSSLVPAL